MAKLIIVPALAMGIGALFYISRHRHHEVEADKPMYPPEPVGGGSLMEAGIE